MKYTAVTADDLRGKVIDSHSHIGLSTKNFALMEYPYASTIEGMYYRQLQGGVDINVIFPYTPELFNDLPSLVEGTYQKADNPLSPAPYFLENEMLLRETYDFCPELSHRFIPFVSVDPGREVETQLAQIDTLSQSYPIYGLKIVPVLCRTPVTALLDTGRAILETARERNWPILLHTTVHAEETFSRADLAFRVIEACPDIRFCLAHCIGFHDAYLQKADMMPNVWVDTSALKIQTQLAYENSLIMASQEERFSADYSDHTSVMKDLTNAYPKTIIWGTDTPAYSYICRRDQGDGLFVDFNLKAAYGDEVAALNSLAHNIKRKVSNENPLHFIFGQSASHRI
ncbi:MAG: amidohydrolase family protein [Spirochaetales bacterium]|jgi:predicted TIM-barrel fold metal-dependent hydrolase|nr:amidohydrolase family protein [Spirochaetales bacterium]